MMDATQIFEAVSRLLTAHPFVGAQASPLMEVIDACDFRLRPVRYVICREGEVGGSLFFLVSGRVMVRRDDQDLLTINAPSLIGHMSLIDGAPRSATCVVCEDAYIGALRERDYERFLADTGPSGTAFRRLLLSSLNQQLLRGNARLHNLLNSHPQADEGAEKSAVLTTMSVLEGWDSELSGELSGEISGDES
ncbi:MAG: cyclic nucleotide-binding domain-containing protein [Myxococcota bacterium]